MSSGMRDCVYERVEQVLGDDWRYEREENDSIDEDEQFLDFGKDILGDVVYIPEDDEDHEEGYYVILDVITDDDGEIEDYLMIPAQNLSFSIALDMLKYGHRMARSNWNGKNMWIALQRPDCKTMTLPYLYIEYPEGHPAYPNGCKVPWLASQTDLLAEDYFYVPREE